MSFARLPVPNAVFASDVKLGCDSGRAGRVGEVAAFDDHEPRSGDQVPGRLGGAERQDGVVPSPDHHGGGRDLPGLAPKVVLGRLKLPQIWVTAVTPGVVRVIAMARARARWSAAVRGRVYAQESRG